MATYLYRLGRFSYQRRRVVLLSWLAVLLVLGGLAAGFGKTANAGLTIPGVESVQAAELLAERFPGGGASGATARVVFAAPSGQSLNDPALKAAVEQTVASLLAAPEVVGVADPYQANAVSEDGSIGYAAVQYGVQAEVIAGPSREELLASGAPAEAAGIQVEFGGEAARQQESAASSEAIGVVIALLVLAVTFGSVLAAGMPLLTAAIGVGIGLAGLTALSAVVDVTATAPTLALMMGLAVGIDYALFIVSRYRAQRHDGMDSHESAARSVATAGSAVVFAGLTVVIALVGLSVVGIPFLTVMGLAAAGTVAVAVLVAITLVPALLGFANGRLDRRKVWGVKVHTPARTPQQVAAAAAPRDSFGTRWAQFIVRRPVPVLLVTLLGLGAVALPALDLRLGLPDEGTSAPGSSARQAYDLLSEGFGPGFNGPLVVVVDAVDAAQPQQAADSVRAAIQQLPDIATVAPVVFNPDGNTATITVIPASGPSTTETEDLVGAIRAAGADLRASTGADVLVTGNTAIGLDISDKLSSALPTFLVVVIGLSLLLLTLVFRSLLVPLKATLGFLLTLAATFGALVAVFQNGFLANLVGVDATGPIVSFLPVLLIGLLFGLAMDYELFLVTRMREAFVHGAHAKESVVGGFRHGARVVTAAALIMSSVFAGFVLGPDATIKSIGFALAFGVLVDAFVVRMTIVPAVMALLGDRAWSLPRWLDRALPHVDIEGEKLLAQLQAEPAGAELREDVRV